MSRIKPRLKWRQSSPADDSEPAHLLTLAPELRAMMLDAMLVSRHVLRARRYFSDDHELLSGLFLVSANILATCHQMHVEGSAILYERNTFAVDHFRDQYEHLTSVELVHNIFTIRPLYLGLVRNVRDTILGPFRTTASILLDVSNVLKTWPNVQSLVIVLNRELVGSLQLKIDRAGTHDRVVNKLAKRIKIVTALHDARISEALRISLMRTNDINIRRGQEGHNMQPLTEKGEKVNLQELEAMVNEAWKLASTKQKRGS